MVPYSRLKRDGKYLVCRESTARAFIQYSEAYKIDVGEKSELKSRCHFTPLRYIA